MFPTIWNYVKSALEAESDRLNNKGEDFDFNIFDEQERLEISPPKDLEEDMKVIQKSCVQLKEKG